MAEDSFGPKSKQILILNSLSIGCSALILCFMIWFKIRAPRYIDRVTLKIQPAIAVIDIIRHFNYIFNLSSNDTVCAIWGFLRFFCFHATTYLNSAIALNIQILYLHEWKTTKLLGPFLYISPILFALVLDLVPLFMRVYGKALANCFIDSKYEHREIAKIILLYVSNYSLLAYCFIIPLLLMIKLLIKKPRLSSEESTGIENRFYNPMFRKLVLRVSLYPLACFLCHLGSIVYNLDYSLNKNHNPFIYKWMLIGFSINGTVNFVCFLLDPFIQEALGAPEFYQLRDSEEESASTDQDAEPQNFTARTSAAVVSAPSNSQPLIETEKLEEHSESTQSASDPTGADAIANPEPSEGETELNGQSSNVASTSAASPPRGVCHVQPITIPGAKDPNIKEKWHTTDKHLDWRNLYRYD